MSRITVKDLIALLQTFDPDLEVWQEADVGLLPIDWDPIVEEGIIEECDIWNRDHLNDVGKRVLKFR